MVVRQALAYDADPDADVDPTALTQASQFDLEAGTTTRFITSVGTGVHMDGSAVYGSTKPSGEGWLAHFHRVMVALPEPAGAWVLVDAFAVADGRPAMDVDELFHAYKPPPDGFNTATDCRYHDAYAVLRPSPPTAVFNVSNDDGTVTPLGVGFDVFPTCDAVGRVGPARGVARMVTAAPNAWGRRLSTGNASCVGTHPSQPTWVFDGAQEYPKQWSGFDTINTLRCVLAWLCACVCVCVCVCVCARACAHV